MRTLGIFVILSLSLGCVERGRPTNAHEKVAKNKSISRPEVLADAAGASGDPLNQKVGALVDNQQLEKLARELLDAKVLTSPEAIGHPVTARKLWRLNEEFIAALTSDQLSSAQQQWLKRYEYFLFEGCDFELNRCLNMDFFALAKNTATVARLLAVTHQSDLEIYYKLLRTSYAIKGLIYDPILARLMLQATPLYLEMLAKKDQLAAKRFAHTLSTVFQQFSEKADEKDAQLIVQKLDLNNNENRAKLAAYGIDATALARIVSRGHQAGGGQSEQYFEELQSLKAVEADLLKHHAVMWKQLNGEAIHQWDQALAVLDQTYRGEISPNQGQLLLQGLKTSRQEIAKKTRQVYLLRFVQTLITSSSLAKKYFFEEDVVGSQLLEHALRSGGQVQPVWDGFKAGVRNLRILSVDALDLVAREDDISDSNKRMFEGTEKNIKFFAVFPQMMALTYHMAKRDAKESIGAGSNTLDFDSAFLIERLFIGQYPSWFKYSTDTRPLSYVETIYSFDFALRTGVFELFDVKPDEFVAEITEQLVRGSTAKINKFRRLVEQRTGRDSFLQFKAACDDMDLKRIRLPISISGMELSPLFGARYSDIFEPITSMEARRGTTDLKSSLMIFDYRFTEIAEEARLDLGNVQRWAEGLLASYRGYLGRAGVSDVDLRMKRATDSLEKLKTTRTEFFKFTLNLFKSVNGCYTKAYEADQHAKLEILRREEAYLRQVHAEIGRLRRQEVGEAALAEQYAFKNLPSGFKGTNRITADGYVYGQIDFLIRSMQYLTSDHVLDQKSWPAIAPRMQLQFGSQLDADNRDIRNNESMFISYSSDVEAFVAQGINILLNKVNSANTTKSNFVTWLSDKSFGSWVGRVQTATILYRFQDTELSARICAPPLKCETSTDLISAEDVLEVHEGFLNALKLKPDERRYYKMAGLYFKADPLVALSQRMVNFSIGRRITRVWGLYDLPTLMVTTRALGAAYNTRESSRAADGKDAQVARGADREAARHYDFERLGLNYFELRRKQTRQMFLIPVSSEVDQTMDRLVGQFVRSEVDKVNRFETVINARLKDIASMPLEQRPRVDISVNETVSENLLSPNLLHNFERDQVIFERNTERCYSASGCSAFGKP